MSGSFWVAAPGLDSCGQAPNMLGSPSTKTRLAHQQRPDQFVRPTAWYQERLALMTESATAALSEQQMDLLKSISTPITELVQLRRRILGKLRVARQFEKALDETFPQDGSHRRARAL